MNSTMILEKRETLEGGIGELCRGRSAFANSSIWGVDADIVGSAQFFYTPLGMLVYVSVGGLEEGCNVYSVELITKGGGRCTLPPLYSKNGSAWCSALTGKISACQILGGKIEISQSSMGKTVTVATGNIRPPRICEMRMRTAE